ncbi:MAG TPA: selenocysteine-specific translation elongation factor [Mycobacteriales bacterium]|nr:selenocysteine-specific translation elongation factor [Mycobacteriales bacterium]
MQVVTTAGHVDHGKSALVRALTGMEPDRLAEERRRGLSLDLGFAWTDIDDETLAVVDVPGHERFVSTMLAGVGPVPAVLFVVAADGGWMPQSAEHLAALDALEVRHGVLAISRSDLADPAPARAAALAELAKTTLAGAPCVEVSAVTGAGLDALRAALRDLARSLPAPDDEAPVRLWVDRSFSISGAGTVVTGTLPAGRLHVGDELHLEPGGRPVRVRGLQSTGIAYDELRGVSRAAVNLRGVEHEAIRRGHALVRPGAWTTTDELDVRLRPVIADDRLPARCVLHVGSAAVDTRIRLLGPTALRLRLRRPLPLHAGDRGLLREPASHRIIGGITVLDVRPAALTRRGAAAARAEQLASVEPLGDVGEEIRRRGIVHQRDLVAMGFRPTTEPVASGWYVDDAELARLADRLVAEVAVWAADRRLDGGLPADAARQRLGLPDLQLVEVVRRAAGLAAVDGRIQPATATELPPAVREAADRLLADLADAPFAAPDTARLAELGLGSRELAALAHSGALLRVTDGIVLAPDADRLAVRMLAALPRPFSVSEARQQLSTTRRVAVPLLELLDRRGWTRRLPDDRRELLNDGINSGSDR